MNKWLVDIIVTTEILKIKEVKDVRKLKYSNILHESITITKYPVDWWKIISDWYRVKKRTPIVND